MSASRERPWTPGPWEVCEIDPGDADELEIVAPNSEWETVTSGIELTLANARLIAAAPEMYEALEWMLEHLCADADVLADARLRATAVLAKARGEEP